MANLTADNVEIVLSKIAEVVEEQIGEKQEFDWKEKAEDFLDMATRQLPQLSTRSSTR